MPLQLRRGNTAEVGSITPSVGELVYDTQLKRVSVGDGSTAGGVPIVGVTTNEAKDAAAASLLAGTHQNISFTYNSTTKALSAKVDILVHDTIEADAIDTAAVKDGSTLVLDVANAILYGDVTGNITGNVTGNVTGNIETNLISSATSSTIVVDTPVNFQTNVTLDSDLILNRGTLELVSNEVDDLIRFSVHANDDQPGLLNFRRSRGSSTSQTAVQNGDRLHSIGFNAFDGTNYLQVASIQARVTGAVSTGVVPTSLRFLIRDTSGIDQEAGRFNEFGNLFLFANDVTSSPLQIFSGHSSSSNASNIILVRSRGAASVPGTTGTPLAVQNGDPIFDFAFAGYDGTNNTAVAQIRVVTDGAVSTGVVPGRFEFFTSNTSGVSASRLQIATTKTTFNNVPVLPTYADETAADAAIGGSGNRVNGMMYYDTALGKIRAVAGGSWTSLH